MEAIKNFNFFNINSEDLSFEESFKNIIIEKIEGYDSPQNFFEDLQHGGCISGLISEFIYNADCKDFYIEHIDDLEWMMEDLESSLGKPIINRHKLPRYVFVCHACFEEYCYRIYNELFEN
jgi:hypothetical protein